MARTPEPDDEQSERFRRAAREMGCDEDEARWDERLAKIVKRKAADEPDEAD